MNTLKSWLKKLSIRNQAILAGSAILAIAGALWFLDGGKLFGGATTWTVLNVSATGKTGFTAMLPEQTGISFTNSLRDEQLTSNQLLMDGSGVAAGDFDSDGLCDLYLCRLDGPNALYKNLGNMTFKDVTGEAGVGLPDQFSTGAVFADIDGDEDLDLLVSGFGKFTCFSNEGNGRFKETTREAGLTSRSAGRTMALADIDGDRDLDLYVANHRNTTLKDGLAVELQRIDGRVVIPQHLQDRVTFVDGGLKEYGEPDVLYRNDGEGRFIPVSWTDGSFLDEDGRRLTGPPLDWGLTAMFRDIDDDGDPDLYVCNDYWTPDRIWINDGKGGFRALGRLAMRNMSASAMGVDFSDIDRDGDLDFFVVDMLSRNHESRMMQMPALKMAPRLIGDLENRPNVLRNTLYLNRGDNTYAEIACLADVDASEWSWSVVFLDVDLDGYEDAFVTTGHARDILDYDTVKRVESMRLQSVEALQKTLLTYPPLDTPNVAFRNLGNLRFEGKSQEWGLDGRSVSHGVAAADLDNDGDLDLIVNNLGSPAGVYRNNSSADRVAVRLWGSAANIQGIGAKVSLINGSVPHQFQEVVAGGRYLSGSDPLLVFAASDPKGPMSIEVSWPSGKKSVIADVMPNRRYDISESNASDVESPASVSPTPFFEDAGALINHVHHENEFDDFARQPLLPNRLSQLGPGVSWHDLNGDGFDDLMIGSGQGGKPGVFLNNGRGGFTSLSSEATATPVARDMTGLLAWTSEAGVSLISGLANFEDGSTQGEAVARFDFRNGRLDPAIGIPAHMSSTGPVAMADIDGDGDLDLFVGGRTIPGRYPQAATSRMLRNEGGEFIADTANSARLGSPGLVSGASFSDIDGDGDPDLILAIEWGPIKVLINDGGMFSDATKKLGLSQYSGWWNGVTVGDLDEDGRLDIVATNWGLNSKYNLAPEHPLRIFYGDFDGNGSLDVIEAHYEAQLDKLAPEAGLDFLSLGVPAVRAKFPTYKQYGTAGIADIFGPGIETGTSVAANTLAHTVFFNRGDRFEAVSLPLEAQFAPSFGVAVADCDGDGHDDVFITQNFFGSRLETPRMDGGRGLWMKGDGKGGLTPLPGQSSGIKVYGDARGCAVADYDRDGRVDLVVAQNGAATRLYRNVGAKPGLRVRLNGPAGNPNGVGATIRLMFGARSGPAREIHAGSGYWSQDSVVPVLGGSEAPTRVWVRWPAGRVTTSDVPAAAEITIGFDGSVTVVR